LTNDDLLDRAASIAAQAAGAGADAAEAYLQRSWEREIRIREGELDRNVEAESVGCGLRVQMEERCGFASTTDLSKQGIALLIETAAAIARESEPDPAATLPEVPALTESSLELHDPSAAELPFDEAVDMARRCEEAALRTDPRVGAGEGSSFSHGRGSVAIASTRGSARAFTATSCSVSSAPVAGEGGSKQRQFWYETRRFLEELPPPEEVGRRAGERAVKLLGAKPAPTGRAAVVFDPLQAARFWSGIAAALVGDAARRKISFLASSLGEVIASTACTLVDDPRLDRAPGSRPFDGEGWPTGRTPLIEGGRLVAFVYDARTARLAGARSTGNALRSYAGLPQPGALAPRLAAGEHDPGEILAAAGRGLYVTQMMGFGMNLVTGDYSRGASGWWFENGEYAFPVHEVTLSGNLRDILRGIAMVGNDRVERSAASSPTFLVESMVISGRRA